MKLWRCFVCLCGFLLPSVVACGQKGTVLLTSDILVEIRFDGEPVGTINTDETMELTANPGEHRLEIIPAAAPQYMVEDRINVQTGAKVERKISLRSQFGTQEDNRMAMERIRQKQVESKRKADARMLQQREALAEKIFGKQRAYLRGKIKEWGQCKTVAITVAGGNLALYGNNGWAKTGKVPSNLIDKIKEIEAEGKIINDVVLTENGAWVLLFGKNGYASSGVSEDLMEELKEYAGNQEEIVSVAYNDSGHWMVIGDHSVTASSEEITEFVREAPKEFGELWTAHFSDDGLVLVYENGLRYEGEVPDSVKKAMDDIEFDVFRLKYLPDGSYFISDRDGNCRYFF